MSGTVEKMLTRWMSKCWSGATCQKIRWVPFWLSWISRQDWILQRMMMQILVFVLYLFFPQGQFLERICESIVKVPFRTFRSLKCPRSRMWTEIRADQWSRFTMLLLKMSCASFECLRLEALLKTCVGQKMWGVRLTLDPRTRRLMKKMRWSSQSAWFDRAPSFFFCVTVMSFFR